LLDGLGAVLAQSLGPRYGVSWTLKRDDNDFFGTVLRHHPDEARRVFATVDFRPDDASELFVAPMDCQVEAAARAVANVRSADVVG
jgi:hypothetical protein